MARRESGLPTLEAFARLIENARGEADYPDTLPTLEWLIRGNPQAAELARELDALVEDCGTTGLEGAHLEAATAARQFAILLAEPDWEDVGDVIADEQPCYESLVRICEARLVRTPDDPLLEQAHGKLRHSFSAWKEREQADAERRKACP